jgi:hypothetical protein
MYWRNSSGPESDTLWKYAGWFVQNVHTAETQQNILSVQLSRQKKVKVAHSPLHDGVKEHTKLLT